MYVNRSLIPTSIKSKVEEWDVFSSITNDYQCCDDQECRTLTVFGRKTWLNPNFRPFFDKNVCKHRKFEKIVLTRSERSRTFDTFFDQGRNVLGTFISYIYILYSVHCVQFWYIYIYCTVYTVYSSVERKQIAVILVRTSLPYSMPKIHQRNWYYCIRNYFVINHMLSQIYHPCCSIIDVGTVEKR